MLEILKAVCTALLFIAYPFISAYFARLGFASLELVIFAILTLWRGVRASQRWLRWACYALALILFGGAYFSSVYLIWLLPSSVYLWLAALFGHTLLNPPPLAERLVRLQYPEFDDTIAAYLREITWVWTAFFAANVLICALLPLWLGQQAWAVYTGVLVYLLMGILGVGEFFYRKRRFPEMEVPPFMETFQIMAKQGPRLFRELGT